MTVKTRMAGYTNLRVREPIEQTAPSTITRQRDSKEDPSGPNNPQPDKALKVPHGQRMSGYTGLRSSQQRAAVDAVTASPQAEQTVVASKPVEQEPPFQSTPKNRMSGYQPLRQRKSMAPPAPTQAATTAPAETATSASVSTPSTDTQPRPLESVPVEASRPKWVRPLLLVASVALFSIALVLAARWMRTLEPVEGFIATYDGHSTMPEAAPTGMPWWMGWQHFLNFFFIALIVRTGLQIRNEKRPPAQFTPKQNSFYSPGQNLPKKMSITTWIHQTIDVLWVVNGIIFVLLLAVSGHWMRIVPTSWDVFPNMLSTALQYASLDWPLENGWIHYNALQMVSYFLVIYVAAPLAIITGLRMSSWWPQNATRLNKIYPINWARTLHFPVMIFFVLFVIVHVFLVFSTGALRNLNHMYTSRDVIDLWGLVIFVGTVIVTTLALLFLRPTFLTPMAGKVGKVTKH